MDPPGRWVSPPPEGSHRRDWPHSAARAIVAAAWMLIGLFALAIGTIGYVVARYAYGMAECQGGTCPPMEPPSFPMFVGIAVIGLVGLGLALAVVAAPSRVTFAVSSAASLLVLLLLIVGTGLLPSTEVRVNGFGLHILLLAVAGLSLFARRGAGDRSRRAAEGGS